MRTLGWVVKSPSGGYRSDKESYWEERADRTIYQQLQEAFDAVEDFYKVHPNGVRGVKVFRVTLRKKKVRP